MIALRFGLVLVLFTAALLGDAGAQTPRSDQQLLELLKRQHGPMPKARLLERKGVLPQTATTSSGTAISFRYLSDGRLLSVQGTTRSREVVYVGASERPVAVIARDSGGAVPAEVRNEDPMTLDAIAHFNRTKGVALFDALRLTRATITSAVPLALAAQIAQAARADSRIAAPTTAPAAARSQSSRVRSPDDPLDEDQPWVPVPGEPGFSDPSLPQQDPFVPGGSYGFLLCETPLSCVTCLSLCQSAGDQARRGCDQYKPAPDNVDPGRWDQWLACINDANRLQIYCGLLCL